MTVTETGEKIKEIISEMKQLGLWKNMAPDWVTDYEKKSITSEQDFSEWLQFVFLPNCLQEVKNNSAHLSKNYIVPQAKRFFSDDVKKGKLLQLLVELDGLD